MLRAGAEPGASSRVVQPDFIKKLGSTTMFYVYEVSRTQNGQAINLGSSVDRTFATRDENIVPHVDTTDDIDFVDDALLNTAPHNAIEHQLLRGDMVGLALMSGAILWSAMGAFG